MFIVRQIGSLEDRKQAELFSAYLVTRGIANSVEEGTAGQVIWVQNEDRLAEAREELAKFRGNPNDERYRKSTRRAATASREPSQRADATRSRTIDLRDRWRRPSILGGPTTAALMALAIVVAVLTGLEPRQHPELTGKLLFSTDGTMREIWSGEVWRLVSPIFLHFGIMHVLFNLLMLRDLGLMIEDRSGSPKYFAMVLLLAIVSNVAQFEVTGGGFGGMSGVNYGLFGYAWIRSRMDPNSGLWMSPSTVISMMVWFVCCFVGVIPGVANWAHAGGLIAGVALGASRPLWNRLIGRG